MKCWRGSFIHRHSGIDLLTFYSLHVQTLILPAHGVPEAPHCLQITRLDTIGFIRNFTNLNLSRIRQVQGTAPCDPVGFMTWTRRNVSSKELKTTHIGIFRKFLEVLWKPRTYNSGFEWEPDVRRMRTRTVTNLWSCSNPETGANAHRNIRRSKKEKTCVLGSVWNLVNFSGSIKLLFKFSCDSWDRFQTRTEPVLLQVSRNSWD